MKNTKFENELLTTEELARRLKLSPRQVANLVGRRVIPRIKIGRTVRFELEKVILALRKFEEVEYGRSNL
jgi:excisionase family DNA binding protein